MYGLSTRSRAFARAIVIKGSIAQGIGSAKEIGGWREVGGREDRRGTRNGKYVM